MPIIVPRNLPAYEVLQQENVFVMSQYRAVHQDIRALRIGLLNLMPKKISTETQITRLLSNSPLQVELMLIRTASYTPSNTSANHMSTFYRTFEEVAREGLDGLIITGAPVEQRPFEEVAYWEELREIMDYADKHIASTLFLCWAAQAGLYHHYGIEKRQLSEKCFGIFPHRVEVPYTNLLRGFDDEFYAPHSRHTTVNPEDIAREENLRILASSPEAGPHIVASQEFRQIYVMGHFEYDKTTLEEEYLRDRNQGSPIEVPRNYYDHDDPDREILVRWRCHGNLFFSNWVNYCVYQVTPYDLPSIR
jgi:homoserine O-succinyltransferase